MADSNPQIGRLALRVEGDNWNAYYAMPHTMDGAVALSSIKMAIVAKPELKQAFMDLMRAAVSNIIEERIGVKPEWPHDPQRAPEHERAGRA